MNDARDSLSSSIRLFVEEITRLFPYACRETAGYPVMVKNRAYSSNGMMGHTDAVRLTRESSIAGTIAFVNGLAGCGKTLMTAIVGSLAGVELMRYNYHLEHVCQLRFLNLIDDGVAIPLIRLQTDLDLYNSMMSRETNFRFSDLSSVWRNSRPFRYLARLVRPGNAAVIPRIQEEKPILHLVTHSILGIGEPLFKALGERLRIIEVVRHPLYMIKQWHILMSLFAEDPRNFFLWISFRGYSLPWFAQGWEELYLQSNRMDRCIYSIQYQWNQAEQSLRKLSDAQKNQVLVIPFEQFVVGPQPFMIRLEQFLGTTATAATRRAMKKQNVPRRMYAEGRALKIYRQYGWEPPSAGGTERKELAKRREFVASEATPEALRVFDELSAAYEAKYLRA